MNKDVSKHLKPPRIKTLNDPFTRLIIKDNRSPNLRPVCLKSSGKLKSCRSEERFKVNYCLPPISPQPRNFKFFDLCEADRTSIKTPFFAIKEKSKKILGNQTHVEEGYFSRDLDRNSEAYNFSNIFQG